MRVYHHNVMKELDMSSENLSSEIATMN